MDGSVMDESKALIPGVTVKATHLATNTVYTTTTTGNGTFVIPNVRLGRYSVAAEATNFRRTLVQDVIVEVGKSATLKITMRVGSVQEEVLVNASEAQELVNTTDAELSTVVDERRVQELPLNGRNASHLAFLQAGVYFERSPDGQGNKLFVHGQRHRSINISLDGIDTQDNLNRASSIMLDQPLLALSAENVQEFKVITGISSAEYSRGGAQISAVTRAGTNEFHGSVFWFHRNTVFNANDFFNNAAGVERPKLIRNQFGGRIGGPIWKDKTFFFFGYEQLRESRGIAVNRVVYTAQARQGVFRYLNNLLTTPENVAANPGLIRSVNILECSANVQATLGRFCVDNRFNMANPATLDPFISGTVLAATPLPNNFDLGDGLNTGGFRFNASSLTNQHLPSFRIDHRINDKHSFYGTINYVQRVIDGDFINNREPQFPDTGPLGARLTYSKGFSAGLTSSFTATSVNEFRFGFLGGENAFQRKQPFGTPYTLDLNTVSDPYEPGGGDSVRDNVTMHLRDTFSWVRGNHQIKFGGEFRHRWLDNYTYFEQLPDIDFDDNDFPADWSEGDLRAFSTGGAVTDIESADYETVRDLMNNLVGAISEVEIRYNITDLNSGFVPGAPERRKYRVREFDAFVQDNWNLRSNLSLNLGLRWEFATVPIETGGLLLIPEGGESAVFGVSGPGGFFNPGVFDGTACPVLGTLPMNPTTSNVRNLINTCAVPNVLGGANNGLPLWDNDFNNFGPVIGVAWDPFKNGKTSVRAGFRISYMQDHFAIIDSNVDDNEGLTVDQDCIPADGTCINNTLYLRNLNTANPPVAAPPPFQLPVRRSLLDSTVQDFRTYDRDLQTPYYQEWTVGFQREVMKDLAVEVRYVGNRGRQLRRVADYNEYNINALDSVSGMTFLQSFILAQQNLACNRANGVSNRFDERTFGCSVANPLMDVLIAGDITRLATTSGLLDALDFNAPGEFLDELLIDRTSRPSSGQSRINGGSFWGAVLAGRLPLNFFSANPFVASSRRLTNDGSSTYHGLEIELRRRFSEGFTMQANYTYGRARSDYDGDDNALLNDSRPSSVQNPLYTTGEFMPRHLFKANWVYELPFGKGKWFGAGANGLLNEVIGGWQFGGIVNWRSGRPLSITSGIGTFHRSAISGDNTVNLSQQMSASELRRLVGRRNIGGGTFWLDPCLSSRTGAACADSNSIQGLFILPNPGELGELEQTPIFGPRRFTFDFNLSKRFKVTESSNMEFRWEVFNAFNHVNFCTPNLDIFSISFGQTTCTITNPRLMQFALKFNF
ncbi:MAG: TonB-dependent receptor [Acidobacteriota bacterium]|nr:TonB-dependent receptor [Acidobacteriota bacterium]